MSTIDLDQLRAARREGLGGPVTARFGGEMFALPPELPVEALEHLAALAAAVEGGDRGAVAAAGPLLALFRTLLGEDWPRFAAKRPSLEDMLALLDAAMPAYGGSAGESPASGDSS